MKCISVMVFSILFHIIISTPILTCEHIIDVFTIEINSFEVDISLITILFMLIPCKQREDIQKNVVSIPTNTLQVDETGGNTKYLMQVIIYHN